MCKSLILSQGDLLTCVQRPISAACFALAVVLLVGPLLPSLRKKRTLVALDEGAERYRGWFGSS
jgi:putative tricarboxylic transport membrane protein